MEEKEEESTPVTSADRGMLFSALADVETRTDRRYDSLNRRIQKLERRGGGLFDMPSEVKGFLLMLALYVGVVMVLPEIPALVRKWQQSQ